MIYRNGHTYPENINEQTPEELVNLGLSVLPSGASGVDEHGTILNDQERMFYLACAQTYILAGLFAEVQSANLDSKIKAAVEQLS